MKKSELMIGDWYMWYAEGQTYYYQVTPETFSLDDDTISNFKPIVPTKEFFLKNGFTFDEADNAYVRREIAGDGFYIISVQDKLDGEFSCIINGGDKFSDTSVELNLQYVFLKVHHLQHYLRDCDIHIDLIM